MITNLNKKNKSPSLNPNILTKDQIISWYEKNINNVCLPHHSSFRQYRMVDYRGVMYKIRRQIRNPLQLLPFIKKWAPLAIYYTTSLWLNPKTIGPKIPKKGYVIADSCLLGADLIFDIDDDNLEIARIKTIKILDVVEKTHELIYIKFTGSKGFNLVFRDKIDLGCHPKDRENLLWENRNIYIGNPPIDSLEFDRPQTLNTRQIIKIPGTLTKSGAIASFLTKEDLQKPIKDIVKQNVPFLNELFKSRMLKKIEQMTGDENSPPPQGIQKVEGVDLTSPSYTQQFITNEVIGTKNRFVLFLHYPKGIKRWEKDLKRLIEKYKLYFVAVFEDEEEITAVIPETFTERRLRKIAHASKANKKYEQKKFHKQFMAINKQTKLLGVLTGNKEKGRKCRAHINFINKFHEYCPQGLEGTGKIRIVKTKFKRL